MHYDNNKPKYIRYAIYVALIVLATLLQNSNIALPEIFGARAFLLLPLSISIAMHEREIPAAVFGAISGTFWDTSSGIEGFNALVIMAMCAVCSILISHLMQNNIVTALVLNGSAIALYELLYVIVTSGFGGAGNPFRQIVLFYLPSLIYTALFIPVFFYVVKYVYESHKTE